jgi:hypothetical protein
MVSFSTTILKFGDQGEKTGWTYILIKSAIAEKIKPDNKKSFRVKGKFDDHTFEGLAMIPMGGGDFIIALNTSIRKIIKKRKGDTLQVQLAVDEKGYQINPAFIKCLNDEPVALSFFYSLPKSHQNYFSKWIESAKTIETKSKRIAMAINALAKKWDYGVMIRTQTEENKKLKNY